LIEHGKADINLKTITGATPLHGAALQGNTGKQLQGLPLYMEQHFKEIQVKWS